MKPVTPAKAGVFIHYGWKIPAFAGMTRLILFVFIRVHSWFKNKKSPGKHRGFFKFISTYCAVEAVLRA